MNPINLMAQIIPNAKERMYTASMTENGNPKIEEVKMINWKQGIILVLALGAGIWFLNAQASKFDEEDITNGK
jgi:hypothetical protein